MKIFVAIDANNWNPASQLDENWGGARFINISRMIRVNIIFYYGKKHVVLQQVSQPKHNLCCLLIPVDQCELSLLS